MKLYVASSWRNQRQPSVVEFLRDAGFECYDFRNPDGAHGDDHGFHWSETDPDWKDWSTRQFRESLSHPIAAAGFTKDMNALKEADAVVLVLPCGRSAHLEAGWAAGAGRPLAIYIPPSVACEPELMYAMSTLVSDSLTEIAQALRDTFQSGTAPEKG